MRVAAWTGRVALAIALLGVLLVWNWADGRIQSLDARIVQQEKLRVAAESAVDGVATWSSSLERLAGEQIALQTRVDTLAGALDERTEALPAVGARVAELDVAMQANRASIEGLVERTRTQAEALEATAASQAKLGERFDAARLLLDRSRELLDANVTDTAANAARLEGLATRTGTAEARAEKAVGLVAQAESRIAAAQQELATVTDRLRRAEAERDRVASLYERVLADANALALDELGNLVESAAQQLAAGADPRGALLLLRTARARAAQFDTPTLAPFAEALQADIARLDAVVMADVSTVARRLGELAQQAALLPVASDEHLAAAMVPGPAEATSSSPPTVQSDTGGFWAGVQARTRELLDLDQAQQELSKMVRVTRVDAASPVMVAPEQSYFLTQNLRLTLMNARLSLLARDLPAYAADLQQAREWLQEHFVGDARSVQAMAAALRELSELPALTEPVSIDGSRRALAAIAAGAGAHGSR